MTEEKKFISNLLEPLAGICAAYQWEDRRLQSPSLETEQTFLKRTSNEITTALSQNILEQKKHFITAGILLHKNLPSSSLERDPIEKEITQAHSFLQSLHNMEDLEFSPINTPQEVFKISQETLKWIYQVGYTYFKNSHYPEALSLFKTLSFLNPLVFDFKLAEALTLKSLKQTDEALFIFALAAIMDPLHPSPRYNSAEIYLNNKQKSNAEIELHLLEEILKIGQHKELEPAILALKNKISLI